MTSNLVWLLRRLSRMTPTEMGARSWQIIRQTIERARHPRPVPLSRRVPTGIGEWASPKWLAPLRERPDIGVHLRSTYGWTPARAQEILGHRYTFFAFEARAFHIPLRWNRDELTGIEAPLEYGMHLDYRDPSKVGNIKYSWEINRHQHLVELAKAYCVTGEEVYAEALAEQVGTWIDQCPHPFGVNWASTLEVAMRLISWTCSMDLLAMSRGEWLRTHREFWRSWVCSSYEHLTFIRSHLSGHSSANNHLLGELCGLFVGALSFTFRESPQWLATAVAGLEREAERQVWPDGVNKEQATAYHCYVFTLLALPMILGSRNGFSFSQAYADRLERMAEYVAAIISRDGELPRIGDDDEGRVLILDPVRVDRPARSLLATAAALFERADFRDLSSGFDEQSYWLLGASGEARFHTAHSAPPARTAFPDGGYYVLSTDDSWLLFDCGPLGYLSIAAHGHADALSVVLRYRGLDFLVDPGSYAYHTNSVWRSYFRGTAAHNTLRIDGQDQSVIGGNFLWLRQARARLLEHTPTSLRGSHDGYTRLGSPVTHERTVTLAGDRKSYILHDSVSGRGPHVLEQFFHCHPGCTVRQEGRRVLVEREGVRIALQMDERLHGIRFLNGSETPPGGWFSPGYDRKVPAITIAGELQMDEAATLTTTIHLLEDLGTL
jgi:uncharacterized heparinase superfamily protein